MQLTWLVKQVKWNLQGGEIIFQPYLDSPIHYCTGKFLFLITCSKCELFKSLSFICTTLSFLHYSLFVSFQDASRTWSIFGSITDKRACNWEDYRCYWNVWCFRNVVFLWSMVHCFEWPLLPYIPILVLIFFLGYKFFLKEIEYLFPFLVQIWWLTAQDIFQLSSFIPWRGILRFLKCYSLCGIGWWFW